jgi:magnesium-transporting ATPase (P-type)
MIEGKTTELESKLKKISTYIEDAALVVLVAVLIVQALFIICMALFGTDEKEGGLFSGSTLTHAVKACVIGIVLLIVIVPEGLALAVQMAMSLSITNLKDSKILVKNHEAIQKAAIVTDICVSKTGVLTSGLPTVNRYMLANDQTTHVNNMTVDLAEREGMSEDTAQKLTLAILANTDVTLQAEDPRVVKIDNDHPNYYFQPVGSAIEKGMINFLADKNIHERLS